MGTPVDIYSFDEFKKETRSGFARISDEIQRSRTEITGRQDKTNGRLDKHDERHTKFMEQLAQHGELLAALSRDVKNLNGEVFERPRRDSSDLTEVVGLLKAIAEADNKPVTVGDVKKAKAMVVALWAVIVALGGAIAWLIANWPKG